MTTRSPIACDAAAPTAYPVSSIVSWKSMCKPPLLAASGPRAHLGGLLQLVVEKPDAGRDVGHAAAVEIDPAADRSPFSVALDRRDSVSLLSRRRLPTPRFLREQPEGASLRLKVR
jgi:hypothetical protein